MHIEPQRAVHGAKVLSRGIHHLALNTDDMKMTIDFYSRVLGMPLVHALRVPPGVSRGNPPFERLRHYFFDVGGDTLLAFFELPKDAKVVGDRNAVAAMQHCSFTVTEERFDTVHQRLKDAGLAIIGPINVGAESISIYFEDPNGIRLEFTCQAGDGSDVRVVERWTQTKDETLEELRSLCDDPDWLHEVTCHLPAERSAMPAITEPSTVRIK